MSEFDLNKTIPLVEEKGGEVRATPFVDEFDLDNTQPVPDESISQMLLGNVKEAGIETLQEVGRVAKVIRWPFWRFIEQPVSTIATAIQKPEGREPGEVLSKAFQGYVPFRKIPVEEYGTYEQIWNNYYKSIMNQDAPDWYTAMAAYGTAVGVEIPAIRSAVKGAERAMTRAATAEETTIVRKAFDPLKASLRKVGIDPKALHAEGSIVRLNETDEIFMNKYVTAVLRGDQVRVPRWANITKIKAPVKVPPVTSEKGIAPVVKEVLPVTGKEVILPPPKAPIAPTPSKGGEITFDFGANLKEAIKVSPETKMSPLEEKLAKIQDKKLKVEQAQEALTEGGKVEEFLKGRVKRYAKGYLKEELEEFPKGFFTTKASAITLDQAIDEVNKANLGVTFTSELDLASFMKAWKEEKIMLKGIIEEGKVEMVTMREETFVKEGLKRIAQGIREGTIKTKKSVKETQAELIKLFEQAGLKAAPRTLKNIQTKEQLEKSLPVIEEGIKTIVEKETKRKIAKEIVKLSEKKIDPDYQEEIEEILSQYDLKMRRESTKKRRISRQEFFEREKAAGHIDFIPQEFFKDIGKKTLDEMTLEEVEQLRDQVSVLATIGETKSRLLSIRGEKDFQKRLNSIVETIYKRVGKAEAPIEGKGPLVSEVEKATLQKALDMVSDYFASHRKVEFITKDLGVNQDIFETIQTGINKELTSAEKVYDELKKAFDIISENMNKMSTELVNIPGVPVEMTREQMIGVALNAGNEGNYQRLIKGNKFTKSQIKRITEALTPKEKEFVRKIFDTIETLFPETVKISKELLGIKPKKVEGDYFPIVPDKDLSKISKLRAGEADLFQDVFQTTFLERYFTKGRIGGSEPVDLNVFRVIFKHVDDVTHFNSLAIPVRDIQKIISDPRFREAITQAMNEETYEQFQPWLRSIANPKNLMPSNVFEKGAAILRHNATTAILGLRMTVSLLQAGSFTQTINEIGIKDSLNGIGLFLQGRSNAIDFIYSKSPIMKNRKMRFDREIRDWLKTKDALKITEGKKSYEEILFELIRGIDFITTAPSWLGAYHKQYDLTGNADEAALYADGVVRRTQPSAAMENLSEAMKGNAIQKLFTSFMTHFSNMHNQMVSAINKLKYPGDHPLRKLPTFARSMWWLWLAPALLSGLVRSGYNVKDWRKYAQEIATYPFAGMMLIRDLTNFVIKGFDFGAPPGLGGLKEAGYAVKGKEPRTKIKHGVKAVGLLTGKIPTQAVDTAEGIIDLMSGQTDDWRRLIWSESALEDVNKGMFKYENKSEL